MRARALPALDTIKCAYVEESSSTLVPPKRATSTAGIPAARAHEILECLSVYGVVDSGSPAAPTTHANSRGLKLFKQ